MRRTLALGALIAPLVMAPPLLGQAAPPGGDSAGASAIAFPSRGDYRHKARISAEFDRFRDTAVVRMGVPLEQARGVTGLLNRLAGPPLTMEVGYVAHGEPPKTVPPGVVLRFVLQDVRDVGQEDNAPGSPSLELMLNGGERLRVEGTRISHTTKPLGETRVTVTDVYAVRMHTGGFLRLVLAQSVDGRIAAREFRLNAEAMSALRDFASRMAPSGVVAIPSNWGMDMLVAANAAQAQQPHAASAPAAPLSGSTVVGATGTSGARRTGEVTVRWTVVDDGSATRDNGVASGEPLTRIARPCSAERTCTPTADLRVTAVEMPSWIAQKMPFNVSYEVENRGRTDSRAVEVVVCSSAPSRHGTCSGQPLDVFTLPSLKAGEVARVRRTAVLNDLPHGVRYGSDAFTVVIDPDQIGGERDYTNNMRAAVNKTQAEIPKLEMVRSAALPETFSAAQAARPVVLTWRIRNAARSTATGDFEVGVNIHKSRGQCSQSYSTMLFIMPSVPARAVLDVTVELPALLATCTNAYWNVGTEPKDGVVPGSDFSVLRTGVWIARP